MTLGWEDVAAIALGVAGGSAPVLLTYALNERSSRRRLEREQEYTRRREKYEQVLIALRKEYQVSLGLSNFMHQAKSRTSRAAAVVSSAEAVAASGDKAWEEAARLGLFATLVEISGDSESPPASSPRFQSEDSESYQKLFGSVLSSTTRIFERAALELEFGLTSLKLVDGSDEFRSRAKKVDDALAEAMGQVLFIPPFGPKGPEPDMDTIGSEIESLEQIALTDLKRLLGRTVPLGQTHIC